MSARKINILASSLTRAFLILWLLLAASTGQAIERVTYYHNDALGSPVAATDRNGTLLWRESYAPYGERLTREASSKNTVWYTGKQEEGAFGINYFGARWYDPKMGRFMGVDPAGFNADNIQSFNKYAYANNNPYAYVDPDGNFATLGAVIAAVSDSVTQRLMISAGLQQEFSFGSAAIAAGFGAATGGIANIKRLYDAAKVISNAKKGSNVAKAGGEIFERVVNNAELKATQKTDLLRGGKEGENFFTNRASLDAKRAQQRLGLDGPLRDARIQFRIKNDVEITGPRPAAPGRTGTAGGGQEFSTNGRTEIEILRVDPLRK